MNCVKCKQNLKDDEVTLSCDSCNIILHRSCSDLNSSELKVMDLKGKRVLKYYCEECQNGIKLIPKLLITIENMQKEINALKTQIQKTTPEEILINEIHERQKRANNVMFYNLPENDRNQGNDLVQIKEIISEIANEDLVVVRTLRVGKKNKNGARPLKVVLQNSDDATLIVRNKRKINKNRKIFIDLDMTSLQMANMKKMKEELNMRRQNGEDIFIKYVKGVPQIVKNLKK